MFVNREPEMKKLMEIAESDRAELVLIYGRRRVGKSRLLTEFARKTEALYLLADVSKNILDVISRQIRDEFVRFNNWDDFFEYICRCRYEIIIIDEFQYLYHVDRAWPTILQRWWEDIKKSGKKIILCGSVISTIYKISMGYGSALYGRKTAEMQINPLKFKHIKAFFPHYNIEDLVKTYSILGGVPRYLEEFNPRMSVEDNIKAKILDKISFLYNEPINIFFEEFRDPAPYISILLAVTQGYTRFSEISQVSRIESHKLSKYLLILERVKILEKNIPVTETKIKSKNTKYRILDNFYKFWFSFVFKNRSMIELGLVDEVFENILRQLNQYFGLCFEDVCREFLIDRRFFQFSRIGGWWHKDREIDIVALNESSGEILFGECKWKEKVDATNVVEELIEKARYVDWNKEKRKEILVVFAKSFSRRIDEFEDREAYCFDLKDLERVFD
jgi:hypothetical protein